MATRTSVFIFYVFTICVFLQIWGIKHTVLVDLSDNFLNYNNTYYEIRPEDKERLWSALEKEQGVSSGQSVLESEYKKQFVSFASLNQKSENKNKFFVVTAIFNPASFQSRKTLYQNFARHMNETGAQLVTIECIFPSLNQTEFQVTKPDNPWHIQLKSESVYWMKENLINIAVSRLPIYAQWVCWLDSEIEFENPNWVELAIKELQKYAVIQMFEKANVLGPPPKNQILISRYSFGYSVVHNKTQTEKYGNKSNTNQKSMPHPGLGWAMAVEDFKAIGGLPDYCIVGSGDRLLAYSLVNEKPYLPGNYNKKFHPEYAKMVKDKLSLTLPKLRHLVQTNGKKIVGCLPVTVRHYWHGFKKDRQHIARWKILSDSKFNFKTDVTMTKDGLLQFNPNKANLNKNFVKYFKMRHEDVINTDVLDTKKKVTLKTHDLPKL